MSDPGGWKRNADGCESPPYKFRNVLVRTYQALPKLFVNDLLGMP